MTKPLTAGEYNTARSAALQYEPRTLEELRQLAGEVGCTFELEEVGTITVDVDCEPVARVIELEHFHDRLSFINTIFDNGQGPFLELHNSWPSRNGGWHHVVRIGREQELSVELRTMIALALGSDYKREMLAVLHNMRGTAMNTGLFKPKEMK
jgi:hypothetical protein